VSRRLENVPHRTSDKIKVALLPSINQFLLRKLLTRIFVFLLAGILFIAVSYVFAYPQLIRCATIGLSDFIEIDTGIYASNVMSATEKKDLVELIKASRQRQKNFWGKTVEEPVIIFCHSSELYQKYGSRNGSPANYFGSLLGSYVVISPAGLDVDVISHEMCHAELTGRLGWLTMNTKVPQWFNEGLALMVDYRFPHANGQISYRKYQQKWNELTYGSNFNLNLQALEDIESFAPTDAYSQQLAYLRSGMEVSRWLEKVHRKGLLRFVSKIQAGGNFEETYQEVEKEAKE
jgi:hypothetical protein